MAFCRYGNLLIPNPSYIYIRQSTEHQVRENIESQQRQYELVDLAKQYKWNQDSIIVIDDDLGRSGSSATGRTGFAKLVADVALKKAGIIFGLEVSRLARNNKDWYQLLDLLFLASLELIPVLIISCKPGDFKK